MNEEVKKQAEEIIEQEAKHVAESHLYVYPCGITEEDDSFRYWSKIILSNPKLYIIDTENHRTSITGFKGTWLPVIQLSEVLKEVK